MHEKTGIRIKKQQLNSYWTPYNAETSVQPLHLYKLKQREYPIGLWLVVIIMYPLSKKWIRATCAPVDYFIKRKKDAGIQPFVNIFFPFLLHAASFFPSVCLTLPGSKVSINWLLFTAQVPFLSILMTVLLNYFCTIHSINSSILQITLVKKR